MPFISSSELCSRIKALYRKTLYLNNHFQSLIAGEPFHLKASKTLLGLPSDSHAVHSLHRMLRLMANPLSGGNKSSRGV